MRLIDCVAVFEWVKGLFVVRRARRFSKFATFR